MLNDSDVSTPASVIAYESPYLADSMTAGRMNTSADALLANIQHAVRLGHPQMRTWPTRPDRVCLVGSGPSLADTLDELRRAQWEGAHIVTLNGSYHWCIEHGIKPDTQIVMDARASNARFVSPAVPGCRYVLASQCSPETWAAVADRPDVWVWHAVVAKDDPISAFLTDYYRGHWFGVGGGTTVATRALMLLRMAGYVRFDLFGVDCCWMGDTHHAMPQPENDRDSRMTIRVGDAERPETMREFQVAPWHLKQFEDFCAVLKLNGQNLIATVHGDGLLAYMLRTLGNSESSALSVPSSESFALDKEK